MALLLEYRPDVKDRTDRSPVTCQQTIRTQVRLCQTWLPGWATVLPMDQASATQREDLPLLSAGPVHERADAARNRAKALAAAERLFAARGVAAVSMDDGAACAGAGTGSLYRRFGAKSAL